MWRTWLVGCCLSGLIATGGCADGTPATSGSGLIETRKTVGKTTQNVLELQQALAAGGVPADMSESSAGLTVASDTYGISMGRMAVLSVEQKLKLYQAEHGSVPETYADFMEKIIEPSKPTGLSLPMLPYYQEYAYDPAQKCLVVIEFPAKKQQRERETTGAAGL
jgi:hypothetical protein